MSEPTDEGTPWTTTLGGTPWTTTLGEALDTLAGAVANLNKRLVMLEEKVAKLQAERDP